MSGLGVALAVSNLFTACIVAALSWPLARRRIAMNRWYGVRFAKSYASDEAWYAINEYGGRRLLLWSVPVAGLGLCALVLPADAAWGLVLGAASAPLLYLIPCVEIWVWARSLDLQSFETGRTD
ncbi:MAG: SdpI family protein [Acidobacteriota bacterium]